MKKIAIIIQKLSGGGAERTASNLSIFLSKYYDVHLIVFDAHNAKYPYGGTLHDLKLPPKKDFFSKLMILLKRIKLVHKIKREEKIMASISLMDGANLVNVLTKGSDRVLTSIRIQMSKSRMLGLETHIATALIKQYSDLIVALSKGVERDLVDNFGIKPNKVVTIYNPCDGAMLQALAEKQNGETIIMPDMSVSTMGRCTEQKGQWHLLRAFSIVVKKYPGAKLYILGDGPLKGKLTILAEELGIENSVEFLGYVAAPHSYIKKSRVFVFPSIYEGLGNVLLEAMACGTPCIAADCDSGPREILAPGTEIKNILPELEYGQYGILTSVGDYEHFNAVDTLTVDELQLAEAIEQMLTDDALREHYSSLAVKRKSDFTPERITEDWKNVLK